MNYSVSVIIPARDEAGTIPKIVDLLPQLGKRMEVIFIEGYSKDDTWLEILKALKNKRNFKVSAYKQIERKGKWHAVEIGFEKAKGDILIILDSDLSVAPSELPKFYKLITSGKAQFVNGSRFFYPKEKRAMRYFNHIGNRFFAFCFSLILKQQITDTLCGTKVLFREDFIKMRKLYLGVFSEDPYGDFSLLLGAAKLGLKVAEVPVSYKARVYGKSKINPFFDGIKLFILLVKDLKNFVFLKK